MRKVMLITCGLLIWAIVSFAQVPRTMNYQARLTDDTGVAIDESTTIAFQIYDAESGGTPVWAETLRVNMVNGLFDVQLGQDKPMELKFDDTLWIQLQPDSDGDRSVVGDPALTPREKLAPVSYSHRAVYADTAAYADTADTALSAAGLEEVLSVSNDAEGTTITDLPSPVADSQAATKGYVDAAAGGAGYYVGYGTTTCSGDYSAAYTGKVVVPTSTINGAGHGSVMCVSGGVGTVDYVGNLNSYSYGGFAQEVSTSDDYWHGTNGPIDCVVCVK